MKSDPGVPINCPLCGASLVYIETEGRTHYYRCPQHGLLMLLPDGRFLKVRRDCHQQAGGAVGREATSSQMVARRTRVASSVIT